MFGSLVLSLLLGNFAGAQTPEERIVFIGLGLHNEELKPEQQPLAILERDLAALGGSKTIKIIDIAPEAHVPDIILNYIPKIVEAKPSRVVLWRTSASLPLEAVQSLRYSVQWGTQELKPAPPPEVSVDFWIRALSSLSLIDMDAWKDFERYRALLLSARGPIMKLRKMSDALIEQAAFLANRLQDDHKIPFKILYSPNGFKSTSGLFEGAWIARKASELMMPKGTFRPPMIRDHTTHPSVETVIMPVQARRLYEPENLEGGSDYILNAKGAGLWAEMMTTELD